MVDPPGKESGYVFMNRRLLKVVVDAPVNIQDTYDVNFRINIIPEKMFVYLFAIYYELCSFTQIHLWSSNQHIITLRTI